MLEYLYDEKTKEYLGCREACIDPRETELKGENVYYLSANATDIPPTEVKENEVSIFNQAKNQWYVEKDFRGQWQVDKSTMSLSMIDYIGEVKNSSLLISCEVKNLIEEERERFEIVDGELKDKISDKEYVSIKLNKLIDEFKSKHIETSFGYICKFPSGYTSALEMINTMDSMVSKLGSLPKDMIKVYSPPISIYENDSGEFLGELSKEEFNKLYCEFVIKWKEEMVI